MDADFSHNPIYIHNFIHEASKGAGLVLSSRYLKGGGIVGWKWYRKIISIGGNFYARLLLKGAITDYTSGFNMFSLDLLREINFEMLDIPGYGFLINLKYQLAKLSKKTVEFPIVLHDRLNGKSKMPASTIFTSFILVLKIRLL
jgi:dolichol-phosphate mannosyltransferase